MTDEFEGRLRTLLVVLLLGIVTTGVLDLYLDDLEDWFSFHGFVDFAMITGALAIVTILWTGWWRAEHSAASLRVSVEAHREERDAWKASAQAALEGLGRAIQAQFDLWRLTPTEREIALMLLKGYGHKEIASLTGRSERTVRQHASVVYVKAGLAGRAELAAFFLQDVMLPGPERDAASVPTPTRSVVSVT